MRKIIAGLIVATFSLLLPISVAADQTEQKIGFQVLEQYEKKGLILHDTKYNEIVDPIAERISTAGADLYDAPFHFYVIHNKQPNAFAVPGGYMFIHDSLIDLVRTQDELACVSGHELSHVIHHDGMNNMKRIRQQRTWLAVGSLLAGGLIAGLAAQAIQIQDLHFSRHEETAADISGSDICAKAGYNPYGLVWMMEQFETLPNQTRKMEMFSDHPKDGHRIADLESHFRSDPSLFSKYSPNISSGIPIRALPQATSAPASDPASTPTD